MATAAQIAANRLNAQKSTGPRTEEGKRRSAQNAWKHGLCAERFFLKEEEQDGFAELLADYRARHRPQGAAEERLVERIAELCWRRDRAGPAEAAAWRAAMRRGWLETKDGRQGVILDDADPLLADMGAAVHNGVLKELSRLGVYEARLSRELQRARAELKELQAQRRAAAAAARAQAADEACGPPAELAPQPSLAALEAVVAREKARFRLIDASFKAGLLAGAAPTPPPAAPAGPAEPQN